jgi:hypothetical protein
MIGHDKDADDSPDPDTEASDLFDHICSVLRRLQGQDLRPIEVVLDQLLGRVRKDQSARKDGNDG